MKWYFHRFCESEIILEVADFIGKDFLKVSFNLSRLACGSNYYYCDLRLLKLSYASDDFF